MDKNELRMSDMVICGNDTIEMTLRKSLTDKVEEKESQQNGRELVPGESGVQLAVSSSPPWLTGCCERGGF